MLFQSIDDKNILYTGKSVPALNIEPGDTLDTVLDKLISAVEGGGVITPPTADKIISSVSTASLGGSSLAVSNITERSFDYSVVKDGDGAKLIYDMSGVKDALPDGFEALVSTVTLIDNTGKKTQSRGSSGTNEVKNFPVKLDFIMGIRTPAGDVEMRKGAVVSTNAEDSKKAIFDVRDFTSSTSVGDDSVETILDLLVAEMSEQKRRLETLTALNLPVELEVLKSKTNQ